MRLPLARLFLGFAGFALGCAPSARVILPLDAHVATVKGPPAPTVEEAVASLQEEASPTEDPFADDAIRPCTDEADATAARAALNAFDLRLYRIDNNAQAPRMKQTIDELRAILATPCFELAAADLPNSLDFETGLAFKTWWNEGQGRSAIDSYLGGGELTRFTVPAGTHPTLMLEGNEKHPLAPLLCPGNDHQCGNTTGWVRRATSYFTRSARPSNADVTECEKQARLEEPTEAWSTFHSCSVSAVPRQTVLPLGQFKAMSDGLFAVLDDGYRCREMTIYDLATGATMKSSDCPRSGVQIGRIPLAVIREAAWNIALSNFAKGWVRSTTMIDVPKGIVAGRPRDHESTVGGHLGGYHTSRRQAWVWLRPKNGALVGQAHGELWSVPSSDAASYAAELLEIADDAFVAGCAPSLSTLPLTAINWSAPGPALTEREGRTPFAFDKPDYAAIVSALNAAKAPARCKDPL